MRQGTIAAIVALVLALIGLFARPVAADEGWVISSFETRITIENDGSLAITETILADFGNLERHGIFRDIPVIYDYDQQRNRVYDLTVSSVTDQTGRRIPYEIQQQGSFLRIRIGDPNTLVSGRQSYVIAYRVQHALNGFSDHDELYWNATGTWPVAMQRARTLVQLPGPGVERIACYQGALGSTEPCRASSTTDSAAFEATRPLPEGEQMTVVVALRKGLVPEPAPKLVSKPRELPEFFEVNPVTVTGALVVLLAVVSWLAWSWWRFGRDRHYRTLYYLTDNPSEETRPLFASDPIVIEYQPPEKLRPAQMGLLLDERADTLDATATIVDLAVRGYLRISEVQDPGIIGHLFGRKDWQIEQTGKSPGDLLDYERTLYQGIFARGSPVKLSDLKNRFYTHLSEAQKQLYRDAAKQKWFVRPPDEARSFWIYIGLGLVVAGAAIAYGLGYFFGAAIVGVPVALGGLLTMAISPWMPKRTAWGSELLRRILGFRLYIATAETSRQQFSEQQNIFSEYLPYAIVFRCVDKWARAFRDIDVENATRTWYTSTHAFTATSFSRNLQGFASDVSSTIVSTPGGSGGSGFSGGGAGGGGGGGGGGSW
jgi:uncharacterized membrane protein YgcG